MDDNEKSILEIERMLHGSNDKDLLGINKVEVAAKGQGEVQRVEDLVLMEDTLRQESLMSVSSLGAKVETVSHEVYGLEVDNLPWLAVYVNSLACGRAPPLEGHKRKRFFRLVKRFYWDKQFLYALCTDGLYRRYVMEEEFAGFLMDCHGSPRGGHFASFKTVTKVLQSGFWWPTLFNDANEFVKSCGECQRKGNISKLDELPHNPTFVVEIFDVWGIDFMGPFPYSFGNPYILMAVDYVSKWVDTIACPTNAEKVLKKLLTTILFPRLGIPRVVISDEGSLFINKVFANPIRTNGVRHTVTTPSHIHTNGHVEITNRHSKGILEKPVGVSRKDWSIKLDDALWAYRTTFNTLIGTTPFNLLCGKSCHLPVELVYKARWAVKLLNFDIKDAKDQRSIDLEELEETSLQAYEHASIYKERTKAFNNKKIIANDFKPGDPVLLFKSRLKLFLGKLKTIWSGHFVVKEARSYGAIVLIGKDGQQLVTNGPKIKKYLTKKPPWSDLTPSSTV